MRVLLHIGLHKTGTSSIQHVCAKNNVKLRKAGFFWPDDDVIPNIGTQHSAIPWKFRIDHDTIAVREFFDNAILLAEKYHCHTILISGEEFSRLNDNEMSIFRAVLPSVEYEVFIV